jgi:hypothetical protein
MPAKNTPKRARTDAQRGVRLIDASTGVTECRSCGKRWTQMAGDPTSWRCPNGCNAELPG